MGFSFYIRVSEVSAIRRENLSLDETRVAVAIPRSKADQEGKGKSALAARTGSFLCPAAAVENWLKRAPDSAFVFPSLSSPNHSMSEDSVRKDFRRVCQVLNMRMLTPHSLRGGAASLALAEGVPQDAVKAAGRWKTDTAFSAYIQPSLKTMQGAGSLL